MAKVNYQYEKRQKELEKKRKKEQKEKLKQLKKNVQIDLDMLLPKTYFDAIDELSERIGMTIKEWINYATIKENNALSGLSNHYLYSPVTNAFLSKYNIGQLKDSTIQHIVKRYTNFSMEEVELKIEMSSSLSADITNYFFVDKEEIQVTLTLKRNIAFVGRLIPTKATQTYCQGPLQSKPLLHF